MAHCGDSWAKAMAFDIFLLYSCSFSVTNGPRMECLSLPSIAYRWVSFYSRLFSTSSSTFFCYWMCFTIPVWRYPMFASPLSCSSYTFVAYVMFISGMGFRSSGWLKGIGQDEQHLWESPRKKWVALSEMHSGGFHTYRGREDTRHLMARFCVRLSCYGSPGF